MTQHSWGSLYILDLLARLCNSNCVAVDVGLLEVITFEWPSVVFYADTPQFCGENPYLFSENPYQSVSFIYASMYRENVHAIHITMQFLQKKLRHCVIQIDIQQQKKTKSELYFTGRDRRIRPTPLIE